jgi:Helix-turn-helix domain
MTLKLYLTAEEVAEQIHVAEKTLANWRVTGFGPRYIKAGQRVLYAVDEIETWLAERSYAHTGEEAMNRKGG